MKILDRLSPARFALLGAIVAAVVVAGAVITSLLADDDPSNGSRSDAIEATFMASDEGSPDELLAQLSRAFCEQPVNLPTSDGAKGVTLQCTGLGADDLANPIPGDPEYVLIHAYDQSGMLSQAIDGKVCESGISYVGGPRWFAQTPSPGVAAYMVDAGATSLSCA